MVARRGARLPGTGADPDEILSTGTVIVLRALKDYSSSFPARLYLSMGLFRFSGPRVVSSSGVFLRLSDLTTLFQAAFFHALFPSGKYFPS